MSEMKKINKKLSHKGRIFLEKREPKVVEDPKQILFLKGKKSNEIVNSTLHELMALVRSQSINFLSKKHDLKPFSDIQPIEYYCQKNICPLFILGDNSKKRPNNIIFGRLYEEKLYDMYEFEISEFKSSNEFLVILRRIPWKLIVNLGL